MREAMTHLLSSNCTQPTYRTDFMHFPPFNLSIVLCPRANPFHNLGVLTRPPDQSTAQLTAITHSHRKQMCMLKCAIHHCSRRSLTFCLALTRTKARNPPTIFLRSIETRSARENPESRSEMSKITKKLQIGSHFSLASVGHVNLCSSE
jgi:hypothetical protein